MREGNVTVTREGNVTVLMRVGGVTVMREGQVTVLTIEGNVTGPHSFIDARAFASATPSRTAIGA